MAACAGVREGPPPGPTAVQSNDQWAMRTNHEGLPVCRDLHGLFTTVIISLSDRWPDWRYELAFVMPAVAQRMQALQFVQIVRDSAGGLHNMLSLSQVKTAFLMREDTAARICDAFLDAGLLVRMPRSDGDVYAPTAKGLHLVDRFVVRNGIATSSVSNLLNKHDVCDKLLFLERDEQDDILLSDSVIRIVFHRLVGLSPRRSEESSLGMALETTIATDAAGNAYETARFEAADALAWIVSYSTCVSADEAAVLLAHMVRLGWLQAMRTVLPSQSSRVATVRVDASLSGGGGRASEGTFVDGDLYHITELGASVAWHVEWDDVPDGDSARTTDDVRTTPRADAVPVPAPSPMMSSTARGVPVATPRASQAAPTAASTSRTPTPAAPLSRAGADTPASSTTPPPSRDVPSPMIPFSPYTYVPSPVPPPARSEVAPATAPSPTARPPTGAPLTEVLRNEKERAAFYAFLCARRAERPLQFWCALEWFRSDCRNATLGALQDAGDGADPVSTLPAPPTRRPGDKENAPLAAPHMRALQRPLLVRSARRHLERFLAQDAYVELGLSAADSDALRSALSQYAAGAREARTPLAEPQSAPQSVEDTRRSEVLLAQLLLQCNRVQKQVYARLADAPLRQFLQDT
ncbi:AMSH/STAMBP protein ubiquitin specific-protease [Malassezia sp. CBS 17886]|nr:AMSH/STAMBP protein ubiquitin specific-protease [Malassezia sp. CBS 17886]